MFRLGGLSKSAGLPQLKLGWMAVDGSHDLVEDALERLDLICDTYLSVSTPVQIAASSLIREGAAVRAAILERVRANDGALRRLAAAFPSVDVLPCEAGWSFVLRVPSIHTEEALVLALLEQDDVLIHPGYFFDFPHEAFVVGSLLPEPHTFEAGVQRVLERAHG
jgi:aspartate/methionine/tyrosine aminotransferase